MTYFLRGSLVQIHLAHEVLLVCEFVHLFCLGSHNWRLLFAGLKFVLAWVDPDQWVVMVGHLLQLSQKCNCRILLSPYLLRLLLFLKQIVNIQIDRRFTRLCIWVYCAVMRLVDHLRWCHRPWNCARVILVMLSFQHRELARHLLRRLVNYLIFLLGRACNLLFWVIIEETRHMIVLFSVGIPTIYNHVYSLESAGMEILYFSVSYWAQDRVLIHWTNARLLIGVHRLGWLCKSLDNWRVDKLWWLHDRFWNSQKLSAHGLRFRHLRRLKLNCIAAIHGFGKFSKLLWSQSWGRQSLFYWLSFDLNLGALVDISVGLH